MQLTKELVKTIAGEEKKPENYGLEIGAWIILGDNGAIEELVFDEAIQEGGYVKLAGSKVAKLPSDKKKRVRGWFHRHPITGLSGLDMNTMMNLTRFWGECWTVVLQSNRKLLIIKTELRTDFMLRTPVIVETYRAEQPMPNFIAPPTADEKGEVVLE